MGDFDEAIDKIDRINTAFTGFRNDIDSRLDDIERKANNSIIHRGGAVKAKKPKAHKYTAPPVLVEARTGKKLTAFSHRQSLMDQNELRQAGVDRDSKIEVTPNTIGRLLRGLVMGGRADDARELELERRSLGIIPDSGGGFTVSGALSTQWVDLLRSKMVLVSAGATTLPMSDGTVAIAKVLTDPVASWHNENAALQESGPTFGQTVLKARTVCALVKMSLELSQDSANIEDILQTTLTQALAHEIDRAGLNGTATDAAGAPLGIFNTPGRNVVSGVGAPTNYDFMVDGVFNLLLSNVDQDSVGAFISHPRLWMKLNKLKTGISGDQTPLRLPPQVEDLPQLYTTAAPLVGTNTTKAVIGKWDDLIFGVRQQIQVRLLTEAFFGSNLQLAMVAYARVDFAPTRPSSFTTLEGITVT